MNAATLKVMAHPLRLRILARVADASGSRGSRGMSPVALTRQMDGPTLGTVSYHVRVLHEAGFLRLSRTSQVRGAIQHHYVLAPKARRKGLLETLDALERAAHEARAKLGPGI